MKTLSRTRAILPPSYRPGSEAREPEIRPPSYVPGRGREDQAPLPAARWLESGYFSGVLGSTFWRPETRDEWCSIVDDPRTEEVILDGSIGWGKTHFALALIMRWAYETTCMASPGSTLLGNPVSVLKFALMSLKKEKAREVLFDKLKAQMERVPYFRRDAKFNDDWTTNRLLTSMVFRDRGLRIEPVPANIGAVISDDLLVFVLDEANFLPRIEGSKRALDAEAASRAGDGVWSAAREFLDKARSRIRSRFYKDGKCHGKVLVISSSIDDNDITEERRAAAEAAGELGSRVRYVSKSLWEGKPPGTYSAARFVVDLGSGGRPPRILRDGAAPAGPTVEVPEDLRVDFESNIVLAVRELAGRRSAPQNLWLQDQEPLSACWDRLRREPADPAQVSGAVSFDRDAMFVREASGLWRPRYHPGLPRAAHIDLSSTGDATGVCVGCSPGFEELSVRDRESGNVVTVRVPRVHADLCLSVRAPPGGRISIAEVEDLILALVAAGLDVRIVTFDQYQSERSIEAFESVGIPSKRLSVDRYPEPYERLRRIIRKEALSVPYSPVLERELSALLEEGGKVDHPAKGSKDVADALAAVSFSLSAPEYLAWAMQRSGGSAPMPPLPL